MALKLVGTEIDWAQNPTCVADGLIEEMRRRGITTLPARAPKTGTRGPEFHRRHETVAGRAVIELRAQIAPYAETGERAPLRI